jgi:hypothetical protein
VARAASCSRRRPPPRGRIQRRGRGRARMRPPRAVPSSTRHGFLISIRPSVALSHIHLGFSSSSAAATPSCRSTVEKKGSGRRGGLFGVHLLYRVLVEIGPEGWTPTQQPLFFSLTLCSLPRRVLLPLALRRKMWKLNNTRRTEGNTEQTEERRNCDCLRCSLLITVCPFHYKRLTIYSRPLGIVSCLNYIFSVPDKLL